VRLGAQISVAGGLHHAFERGVEVGCESIMIFTKSNRQWKAKPLSAEEIHLYHEALQAHEDVYPVTVHASYLINIASSNPDLWQRSYNALKVEIKRAEAISAEMLVFHPGAYVDASEEQGLENIARALNRLLEETAGCNVTVCLETMAGQGTTLGHRFEHLAWLRNELEGHSRVGVCLDTCHLFSAGYDIRAPEAYEATMKTFDDIVGLRHVKCFHFNDSQHPLDARKDRHEHIGKGEIGLEAFANFVNDPRWKEHPAYLETPKTEEDEGGNEVEMDPVNLRALRQLIRS
jgi:deoxyribonuclease-4